MQTELNSWLSGDLDYDKGLELIRQHLPSGFLIQLLSSGPDAYNTPKLLSEIIKLRDTAIAPPAVVSAVKASTPIDAYYPNADLEKKMRIDAIIKQLWKEICHLHGQLSVLPEGEKLYECANAIMVKNMKRQDLWDQLHYYQLNGVWFDDLAENKPKPYDLEQKIKNLMSSRAKARKILKKPLPDGERNYQIARIAEFDKQIEDLRKLRK